MYNCSRDICGEADMFEHAGNFHGGAEVGGEVVT